MILVPSLPDCFASSRLSECWIFSVLPYGEYVIRDFPANAPNATKVFVTKSPNPAVANNFAELAFRDILEMLRTLLSVFLFLSGTTSLI